MLPSLLSIFLVAACIFVPMFGIALFIMKSARRAFGIAAIFALGSVFGWIVSGAFAGMLVGHAVSAEVRDALTIAIATGGAVSGGVIAVWLLTRKTGLRS